MPLFYLYMDIQCLIIFFTILGKFGVFYYGFRRWLCERGTLNKTVKVTTFSD